MTFRINGQVAEVYLENGRKKGLSVCMCKVYVFSAYCISF